MQIVRAQPQQAADLTALAVAAKCHWGYPAAWIEAWRGSLTVTAEYIAKNAVYVALREGVPVGFVGLRIQTRTVEIDHLWVRPDAMGSGVGRMLFRHVEKIAAAAGATRIVADSDPHAEGFYLRMGASNVGQTRAPIAGLERELPRIEKVIVPSTRSGDGSAH